MVQGGTDHIPNTNTGYSPFEFVKTINVFSNKETFEWFKNNYSVIADIDDKEKEEWKKAHGDIEVFSGNVDVVLQEMKDLNIEFLKTIPFFDEKDVFLKGAVCRIGAYSNTGKSHFGYFLSKCLIDNGYSGAMFSTEVRREILLARVIGMYEKEYFKKIVSLKQYDPDTIKKIENLYLYDQNTGATSLETIEASIEGKSLDFIMTDFSQSIKPKQRGGSMFEDMRAYALEIQEMAQRHNILVIDISQVSNEGVKDQTSEFGMLAFKGSGDLTSSADIGILLKRKKDELNAPMQIHIRKHKYSKTGSYEADCDLAYSYFYNFRDNDTFKI